MTDNIDRAVEILDGYPSPHLSDMEHDDECYDIIRDFIAKGLLMPDLPEPVENEGTGNPSWFDGWVQRDWGEVELHHNGYANGEEETTFTPQDARTLAYALLAAANYAERNQG